MPLKGENNKLTGAEEEYRMRRILSIIVLLFLAGSMEAQVKKEEKTNAFTLDAQLMSRGEVRQGGLPGDTEEKDENRSAFISNRARISLGYEREHLAMSIAVQHQGVWGAEGGGSFNLYEAWAKFHAENGLFATIGRQKLVYDDERILGSNDWAMAALYHDALKLGYEHGRHKLHGIVAYNQNGKNVNGGTFYQNGSQPYKSMETVWYHYDFKKLPLGVSVLFMNIGMQTGTPDEYSTTFQQLLGGYLNFKPGKLSLEAAYYRQMGKASIDYTSQTTVPLRAWMASVKATYPVDGKLSGYAGYDYLSGDEEFMLPDPGFIGTRQHNRITAFTSVFGSSHKFYGAMDFFYVSAYYHTFSPGLQNIFAGAEYKPGGKISYEASYHFLSTSVDINGFSRDLGHEVELRAQYQLMKDAKLTLGFSYMRGSETMVALKRSTDKRQLSWGWIMLNITPRIF